MEESLMGKIRCLFTADKNRVTRHIPVTGRHFSSHFMKGISIEPVVLELNSPKT